SKERGTCGCVHFVHVFFFFLGFGVGGGGLAPPRRCRGEPIALSTCSRADPPGEGVEARSRTFRRTAHSTVVAVHRDGSHAEIDQLLKVVCCRVPDCQPSRMVLLRFEICRSEKTDPSSQAAPARKKLGGRRPTELAGLQALEAGTRARSV